MLCLNLSCLSYHAFLTLLCIVFISLPFIASPYLNMPIVTLPYLTLPCLILPYLYYLPYVILSCLAYFTVPQYVFKLCIADAELTLSLKAMQLEHRNMQDKI